MQPEGGTMPINYKDAFLFFCFLFIGTYVTQLKETSKKKKKERHTARFLKECVKLAMKDVDTNRKRVSNTDDERNEEI